MGKDKKNPGSNRLSQNRNVLTSCGKKKTALLRRASAPGIPESVKRRLYVPDPY